MFDDKSVQFDNQQRALNRILTGSVFGDLYQIYYSLKVFVKHVGLTQRGEGACVSIPIRILPLPIKLDSLDDLASVADFDITLVTERPSGRQSVEESKVHFSVHKSEFEMDFESDSQVKLAIDDLSQVYFERFVEPWEKTWKKGESPKVMTEKEIEEEQEEMRFSNSTSDKRPLEVMRASDVTSKKQQSKQSES